MHMFQEEVTYRLPSTGEEVLGIFLNDPTLFSESRRKLTISMFNDLTWLYSSMLELDNQKSLTFKSLVLLNNSKTEYLLELRESVPSNARLPFLIGKLRKEYLAAEIQNINQRIANQIYDKDPNELLSEFQGLVNGLSNTEAMDLNNTEEDIDDFFDWVETTIADPQKAFGLLTGNEEIDRITTGFHRGDFIVVGARTSIGKSAFIVEIALSLAKRGYKVAIYSLEMSKKQIYYRMLANLMTVDYGLLKTGRMLPARIPEMRKYKEFLKQIYIDDTRGVSADYITDSMRRLKRTRGVDAAIADYLQDIRENGETNDNGGSALARICRKLRKGAQEMDVAMFGLSQVNRNVEDRQNKRPMASDLTGSAGIESSADVIALLYREDYYDPKTNEPGILEVNFAKQRNADTGMIKLSYNRKYQQIKPLTSGRMF